MKPTQKIQIEIYSDKLAGFYMALFTCKVLGNPAENEFRKIIDAVKFDRDSFLKFFEPDETQRQKTNEKLLSIHQYLLKSKKDSEDYFTVSKENFEKFQSSDFGKELFELMKMIEIFKQWSGKEKTVEVKTAAAVMTTFISLLMQGLGKEVSKSMNNVVNTAAAMHDAQHEKYKISSNEKGDLLLQFWEAESIEMELFIEKNGHFVKTDASSETDIDFEKNNSFFLKAEEQFLQFRPGTDDSYEIIHYENVSVKKGKLDLSKATVKHKITAPKEQEGIEVIEEPDGSIIYQRNQIPEESNANKSTIQLETTETITLSVNPASVNSNRKEIADENIKTENQFSVFTHFDEFLTQFLKLPGNVPEHIETRDKVILGFYELLKKHYPGISKHSSCAITGFICAQTGWMETEDQHIDSDRKQTYRKYLTDTIGNTLRKHKIG